MSIENITIVITSFKSEETINDCLSSIDKKCRVILVENSNNFDFKKKIESNFKNVECILSGENLGYSKANNIGLKKVKTKYALILNPDTRLYPSTLENFISVTKQVPDFAIIGPNLEDDKNFKMKSLSLISVKNVKGFAMFLNLSEFRDIGFFDEDFFIYFEEIDLCKRLIDSNKKIYVAPAVKIKHYGATSHNKSINYAMELSRNWHWMWSTFNYHKKYKGFFISSLIVSPKLFSAIFKIIFYSLFMNKDKKEIYYHRYSGLINAIMGKSSWYRPKV